MHMALYVISINNARFDMEDINGLKMLARILEDDGENTYIVLN
jgi:hypothetical protein